MFIIWYVYMCIISYVHRDTTSISYQSPHQSPGRSLARKPSLVKVVAPQVRNSQKFQVFFFSKDMGEFNGHWKFYGLILFIHVKYVLSIVSFDTHCLDVLKRSIWIQGCSLTLKQMEIIAERAPKLGEACVDDVLIEHGDYSDYWFSPWIMFQNFCECV